MRVGFTGTRKGMSPAQREQLALVLYWLAASEFHHGGAAGADTEADKVAMAQHYHRVVHPCPGVVRADRFDGRTWEEVFPPLVRNRRIVEACDVLVAAPETDREVVRSGTWATVRYARQAGKPVVMLSRGGQ